MPKLVCLQIRTTSVETDLSFLLWQQKGTSAIKHQDLQIEYFRNQKNRMT